MEDEPIALNSLEDNVSSKRNRVKEGSLINTRKREEDLISAAPLIRSRTVSFIATITSSTLCLLDL